MKIISLAIVVLTLIISNIYFASNYWREQNRSAYFETQVCEFEQLNKLHKMYKPGASKENMLASCNTAGFNCNETGSGIILEIGAGCPASGRQYCGFVANFNGTSLESIAPGYPCH